MPMLTTLSVRQNTAKFSDVSAMNEALKETDVAELLCGEVSGEEFIKVEGKNITLFDQDDGEYVEYLNTYGGFGLGEAKVISEYVTSGMIVFELDTEGNPSEFIKITPNHASIAEPSF